MYGFLWLGTVIVAGIQMQKYQFQPGSVGSQAARWPGGSLIRYSSKHDTLILFAHPKCPCTRATIGELALLMTKCKGKLDAHVLFLQPVGMSC